MKSHSRFSRRNILQEDDCKRHHFHQCAAPTDKDTSATWNPSRLSCMMLMLLMYGALVTVISMQSSDQRLVQVREHAPVGSTYKRVSSRASASPPDGDNILCIFTGRWEFLRVNFPYVYRDLRRNGGVLDLVYYIMLRYDKATDAKLRQLAAAANRILGDDVFQFRYLNHIKSKKKRNDIYTPFYYVIFDELVRHPHNKYFKMDDDIVYIHPGAFRAMIEQQNSSDCFIHFGNIVTNLRGNYIHQQMGVFTPEINPKNLRFDYSVGARCGWKSPECASIALNGFLHHYHNGSLDKYLFEGRQLMEDRSRFSINFMLLDINLIDLKHMLESGPIHDDEQWWTVIYSGKVKNPNCVVGRAFVVHFSYFKTIGAVLKGGFLAKFESIVKTDFNATLPKQLWKMLNYSLQTDRPSN